MSYSFKLKSHPDRLLVDHLKEVGRVSEDVARTLSLPDSLHPGELVKVAYVAGICHDFGKSTTYFQRHLEGLVTEKAFHAQISALFAYHLASEAFHLEPHMSYLAYYAVYHHHTNMKPPRENRERLKDSMRIVKKQIRDIRENNLEEVRAIYSCILSDSGEAVGSFLDFEYVQELSKKIGYMADDILEGDPDPARYFNAMLIYSSLLYADKMNASGIDYSSVKGERDLWVDVPTDVAEDFRKAKGVDHSPLNLLRNEAYSDVMEGLSKADLHKHKVLSVELPTGAGKTIIGLSTALRLRERIKKEMGFTPTVVYSLPFLSIIDQTYSEAHNLLSGWKKIKDDRELPVSLLMEHHHLSDIYYSFGADEDSKPIYSDTKTSKDYLLLEGWNSEFVVTSFVQLFHTLITNKNSSAMKFHKLANSIIILDEIQSIPFKYFGLVRDVIEYVVMNLNSWVVFMTATMPAVFDPSALYFYSLVPDPRRYFNQVDRVDYAYDPSEIKVEDLAKSVLARGEKRILVVLNTIQASVDFYRKLEESIQTERNMKPSVPKGYAEFDDIILVNLSTKIIPAHREARLGLLKDEKSKRVIAVTTQIVEAGVDIDMDVVFRDVAPLDSIVQAGGRCNRNGKGENGTGERGEVNIVNMVNEHGKSYADRIYDPTDIAIAREILKTEFEKHTVMREKEMHSVVQHYYDKLKVSKTDKSADFIKALQGMDFAKISEFKLIENERPRKDVFIQVDKNAEKIWTTYTNIREIEIHSKEDLVRRKNEFLKIRKPFYSYVVSVDLELVRAKYPQQMDEPVVLIDEKYYNKETGVNLPISEKSGWSYDAW